MKELKAKVQENVVTIGTARVIKGIKSGKLKTVYVARNCPHDVKEDLAHYTGLAGAIITDLDMNNEELGVFCRKNFSISVIGA
jgi:large subunit ribosomal protein L30e